MTGGEGGWTLHPLPGPSCDWPRLFLDLMRQHPRGQGMIQTRDLREMDSQTVSPRPKVDERERLRQPASKCYGPG